MMCCWTWWWHMKNPRHHAWSKQPKYPNELTCDFCKFIITYGEGGACWQEEQAGIKGSHWHVYATHHPRGSSVSRIGVWFVGGLLLRLCWVELRTACLTIDVRRVARLVYVERKAVMSTLVVLTRINHQSSIITIYLLRKYIEQCTINVAMCRIQVWLTIRPAWKIARYHCVRTR